MTKKIDRLKDKMFEVRRNYCDFIDNHPDMNEEQQQELQVLQKLIENAKHEFHQYKTKIKK